MQNINYKVALALMLLSQGTSGYDRVHFLSHSPSVAALGRGETGTGFFSDLSSLYFNPSLGTSLQGGALSISYYRLFDTAMYNFAAVGYPVSNGSVSFSALNLRSGDVEIRQSLTDSPLVIQTNYWVYSLTWAKSFARFYALNVGASIKYVYYELYNYRAGGTGLDIGASRAFDGPLISGNKSEITVGTSVQNLMPPRIRLVSEEEVLERIYRIGASLSFPTIYRFLSKDTLSIFADASYTENRVAYYSGLEYIFCGDYAIRTGFYRDTITAGLGYRHHDFIHVDYATDFVGDTVFHRVGFDYYWGGKKNRKRKQYGKASGRVSLLKEARKTLEEAKKQKAIKDREIKPLFETARKEYRRKEYLKAADKFRNIMLQYPEYIMARLYYEKIENEMNRVCRMRYETDFEKVSYALGYVNYRKQEFNEAVSEWEKVLQINPGRAELREYSTSVKEHLKDLARITREKESENKAAEIFAQAAGEYDAKNWVSCVRKMEQVQNRCIQEPFPSSLEWHTRAQEYISRAIKELSKAATMPRARNAAGAVPNKEAIIDVAGADKKYHEGLICYAQGKIADALRTWEIALRFNPHHEKAKRALERAKGEIESRKKR